MGHNRIQIRTEGDDAYEKAKEQLSARSDRPDEVVEVDVAIVTETSDTHDGDGHGADDDDDVEYAGDEMPYENELELLGKFYRLRTVKIKGECRAVSGNRAYPILRYIGHHATEDDPVDAGEMHHLLGQSTSSTCHDLDRLGLIDRERIGPGPKGKYVYHGLTDDGAAELRRLERVLRNKE